MSRECGGGLWLVCSVDEELKKGRKKVSNLGRWLAGAPGKGVCFALVFTDRGRADTQRSTSEFPSFPPVYRL